jgi:hypothetical protein
MALGFTQPLTEMSIANIKKKYFWGVKCGPCVGLTALPPSTSMSRLSRQCGAFNISQPYRPPRPVNEKVAGSIPDEAIGLFFNLSNPSSRTMAHGSTQPLIEMSTRNLSGGEGRPERKAITVICETLVWNSGNHNFLLAYPKCNFSSIVYPSSCWCIIQVMYSI